MERLKFIFVMLILAFAVGTIGSLPAVWPEGSPAGENYSSPCQLKVVLPKTARDFPEPLSSGRTVPGFRLRGTKGWAWTPEQYLAEIPFLVRMKMNFLMNCYTSMFSDPEKFVNRWWEPLPDAKKRAYEKVVKACQEQGIDFCFAIHPQLGSERPLKYDSEEDYQNLWQHFAWMQGLGVRWYSLSYDDIGVEGEDKAKLAESQARLVNRLFGDLRRKEPRVHLIFCPVYYWGDATEADAKAYLGGLARTLDSKVLVFWTGDGVVTPQITARAAAAYKAAVRHELVIWDNYPVNDRSGALHLGPVSGRDTKLSEIAYGYMSNPLSPQNEINRIPLSTCADFAWNPWAYDPARSIGQAIVHLARTESQRAALKDLIELYPGNLACGLTRTDYNCVLEEFRRLSAKPDSGSEAAAFVVRVKTIIERFEREFPLDYPATKATLHDHLAALAKLGGEAVPKK
jgi:hypothetical protein